MAEIVLTRVDFRLIHGQVVAAWNKYVNATKIVIIDDVLAQDELMQTIYTSAAPPGVKVKIYDYAKAKRLWEKNRFGENGRVMVIFRNLQNCLKAFELGINLGKVQIGGAPSSSGKKIIDKQVYMGEEDIATMKRLKEEFNAEVYLHVVPAFSSMTYEEILNKYEG